MTKNEVLQSRRLIFKVLGIGFFLFCAAVFFFPLPTAAFIFEENFDSYTPCATKICGQDGYVEDGTNLCNYACVSPTFFVSSPYSLKVANSTWSCGYNNSIGTFPSGTFSFDVRTEGACTTYGSGRFEFGYVSSGFSPLFKFQICTPGADNRPSIWTADAGTVFFDSSTLTPGAWGTLNGYWDVGTQLLTVWTNSDEPIELSIPALTTNSVSAFHFCNNEGTHSVYYDDLMIDSSLPVGVSTTTIQFYNFDGKYIIPNSITCLQGDSICHMNFTFSQNIFINNVDETKPGYSTTTFDWFWPTSSGSTIYTSDIHTEIWKNLIGIAQPGVDCSLPGGCPILTNFPEQKLLTVDFTFPTPTSSTAYYLQIADPISGTQSFKIYTFLLGGTSPEKDLGNFCDYPCAGLATSTDPLDFDNFVCGLNKFGCWLVVPSPSSLSYISDKFQTIINKFPLAPFTRLYYDLNLAATGTQAVAPGNVQIPFYSTSSQNYFGVNFDLGSSTLSHSPAWVKFRRLEVIGGWCLGIVPIILILIKLII
jgi:hypothetical protein